MLSGVVTAIESIGIGSLVSGVVAISAFTCAKNASDSPALAPGLLLAWLLSESLPPQAAMLRTSSMAGMERKFLFVIMLAVPYLLKLPDMGVLRYGKVCK